jgi:hypothetical protein
MAFSHPKPTALQVNTLQFSSNPNGGATVPLGLSYNRFQKPQPIVIQKIGSHNTEKTQGQNQVRIPSLPVVFYLNNFFQAFQFANVSSDSMMQAVLLAKRDLKQKRLEESLVSNRSPPSRPKTKDTRSEHGVEKSKKKRTKVFIPEIFHFL